MKKVLQGRHQELPLQREFSRRGSGKTHRRDNPHDPEWGDDDADI